MRFFFLFFCISIQSFISAQQISPDTGMASYYANGFNGRTTSFGEKFNIMEFTGAHRKLPYNTIIKVSCLANLKSVIIRINDRGPHTKNRILDLSPAAAKNLGILNRGISKVYFEILSMPDNCKDSIKVPNNNYYAIFKYKIGKTYNNKGEIIFPKGYCVQLYNSQYPDSVCKMIEHYKSISEKLCIKVLSINNHIQYKIMVGDFDNTSKALKLNNTLKNEGYKGFVTQYNISKNGNRPGNNKTIRQH